MKGNYMIKLFTHTDLDGVSNAVIAFINFDFENVDVEYCNYNNVNDKVKQFLFQSNTNDYDKVFITDISVNDELAKKIDNIKNLDIKLFDHHPTAIELNKYKWAKVEVMLNETEKTCGTKLFYDYLRKNSEKGKPIKQTCVRKFVDTVRKYDTWQWKAENDTTPKLWNDLLYIIGREEFTESISYRLEYDHKFEFSDFDRKILDLRQRKIDSYVKAKDKQIIVKDILGHKAGVVFGEQFSSELGNRLCDMHPELEFIVIINLSSSISYRSIGDSIDLGKDIASVYGGGGHPNASGSPLSDDIRNKVLNLIFNK
jgi:oligoribonuclease NrnB/cAMP/cGMP phosphodiesterase (DHH superfamily)